MRSTARETLLTSHAFVVLMPTHITLVKKREREKKKNCPVHVASLYVNVAVCFMSLCTLWSLCVFVYPLILLHRFIFFI